MIISLHLPKTGGVSFATALEQHYGAAFLKDYDDFPVNTPTGERNSAAVEAGIRNQQKDFSGVKCIHGHFLPVKYLPMAGSRDVKFVTWMRHPMDRMLSHYHFWRNVYDPATARSFHTRVVEEDWTLERFCLGPEVRNLYGQFLWKFPVEKFDFVGITEFYEEDLKDFSRHFTEIPMQFHRLNEGERKRGEETVDASFRKKFEEFHQEDMELYRWALQQRMVRCAS